MRRFEDWPIRLNTYIEAKSKDIFEWGRFDCALFVADGIFWITGVDPATAIRGAYFTKEEGAAVMMEIFGSSNLEEVASKIAKEIGAVPVEIFNAQRGDAALFDTPEGPALGLCIGRYAAFPNPEGGLSHVPMSMIRKAWRI